MDPEIRSKLFKSAAGFNWLVGVALLVNAPLLFELFGVEPAPQAGVLLHLFAALVFIFGIGYYWAANDLEANAPVVRLGMYGKLAVFTVGLLDVILGVVSWQILLLLSVDLVYAILFYYSLKTVNSQ